MRSQDKWQAIIGPVLAGTPFELVGVECIGAGKHTVIRVYVDKPGGINIDEIAHLSRQISVILDVKDPVKGHYTLEVSSPGIQRPLFKPEHFKQQLGQKVYVKTRLSVENRLNFKGILRDAQDQGIQIEVDGQQFSINYEDIVKAKTLPDIKIANDK